MSLDPIQPGVWRNPAWVPGTPGMFALLIGISEYAHLKEDTTSLHMGKLHVSALTAYRFFEWLGRRYQLDGVPVAACRMLLAPTKLETATEAGVVSNQLLPDFDNCQQAILEWFHEMEMLPVEAAKASRSLFFFSGHGLELYDGMQVLLPRDYLRPPVPQYNRAIGTNNLRRGIKALKVPLHFMFLDACRNDHENLSQQDPIEGERILNPVTVSKANSNCQVSLFFASASGEQAFQPVNPALGVSLFGEALIEGLSAIGLEPSCTGLRCVVSLDPLLSHCKRRIPEIARDKFKEPTPVEQQVRVSGDYVQDPVTEVPRPAPPRPPAPQAPAPLGTIRDWAIKKLLENVRFIVAPTISTPYGDIDVFSAGTPAPAPAPPPVQSDLVIRPPVPPHWQASPQAAHDLFGHERVTDPFYNSARVYSYSKSDWLPKGEDFIIHSVAYNNPGTSYEVEFSVPGLEKWNAGWFEISDSARRFGMQLPPSGQALRFQLRFGMGPDGGFSRMALNLAASSPAPYGRVAGAWTAYTQENLGSAQKIMLAPDAAKDMEKILAEKVSAPLGAAIAGLLMVRARQWPLLHDWLRNLANFFPEIPDGPALWAEQLLTQQPITAECRKNALHNLLILEERSLPLLTEVMGIAYARMLEFNDETDLGPDEKARLVKLIDRYRKPIMFMRQGGLFSVWAGPPWEIVPQMARPHQLAQPL